MTHPHIQQVLPVFGFTVLDGNVGSIREYELFQELLGLFTLSARKNLAGKALEQARLEVAQSALDLAAEAPAVEEVALDLGPTVNVQTVAEIKDRDDVFVIDVREQHEYDAGHIPGVTLIPMVFALSLLIFIWGMFKFFILGGANDEDRAKGKQLIIWAIIGFVLMVLMGLLCK